MTCKIECGSGWQGQEFANVLCKTETTLTSEGMHITIETGGLNKPTKVYVIGGSLDFLKEPKVKPWTHLGVNGYNLYGNGAEVSLLSPDHPYHLKVTHLPKEKV